MLPCVCSVIDDRWRQNVVRTKKWHTSVSLMFLPHFDVLCHRLLNRHTATWNLFVLVIMKSFFISKYFNIRERRPLPRPCPLRRTRKKAIWRDLSSIQNEVISLVSMRSNELWLVQENHATVRTWLEQLVCLFWWDENLQRKQNWAAKSKNLKENAGKAKSIFVIRAALWAEKLEPVLHIAGVEKIPSESLWLRST